jgi:hypothetical protein
VWLFNGDLDDFPPKKQSLPFFKTYHLGPVTAWSFTEKHLPKVMETLRKEKIPSGSRVLLCVGEVDCRWHLPLQAHKQGKKLDTVVSECMDRYFESFLVLSRKKYDMYAWGTHPTTTGGHNDDRSCPVFGNVEERNRTCKVWNSLLLEKCKAHNVKFVSIYEHLVDEKNITKTKYFRDYCHLGDNCIPLVLDAFGLPQ